MDHAQRTVQDIQFKYVMHARQGQFQGRTQGELELKKPSQLKLRQTSPEKLTIFTDGKTLWLYSPKQKQVLKGDWADWVTRSRFPLPLMNFIGAFGSGSWQQDYESKLEAHEDRQYIIVFTPKKPDANTVVLYLSDETFLPSRGDLAGRTISAQVRIKEIHTNRGLKEGELIPHWPPGTTEVPVTF
jgi:outer membrane lipoprotein-sorting protein